MNERAARERLVAKHTSKVRKAFDESFDQEAILRDWESAQWGDVKVTGQMGRDWARIHITANTKPMRNALDSIYANSYVLGEKIANQRIAVINKAPVPKPKVTPQIINWSTWKPGLPSAAALVRPKGGLKRLLDSQSISISHEVARTKIDRIGTVLADSLEVGASVGKTARAINEVINDPEAAMVIARTETARAMSVATRDRYEKAGIQLVEWLASDACDLCEENAGVSPIGINDVFPSGDTEPPAHPNCECDLIAYSGDDEEELLADMEE